MNTERKIIVTRETGVPVSALGVEPSDRSGLGACVILGHGAGGNMNSHIIRHFQSQLAVKGLIAVRFNFPYAEQMRRVPDRQAVLEDCFNRVIDKVTREYNLAESQIVLGGVSMGGRIASHVASSRSDISGLVFLGYPLHRPGNPHVMRDKHLYGLKQPMLFITGTRDFLARKEILEKVLAKLGAKAQVRWVDNADHSLKIRGASVDVQRRLHDELVQATCDWITKLA